MSKHTPEPWFFEGTETPFITSREIGLTGICDLYHLTEDKKVFTKVNATENGQRIVACVNACAGMEDPEKEIAALREHCTTIEYFDERHSQDIAMIKQLKAENDTLRGLLGNSALPCSYCGLPANEQGKCERGFPLWERR